MVIVNEFFIVFITSFLIGILKKSLSLLLRDERISFQSSFEKLSLPERNLEEKKVMTVLSHFQVVEIVATVCI